MNEASNLQRSSAKGGLNRNAATASVATALLLLLLKGWATWHTGSAAMLGSLADTGLDLFASVVTLFSVVYAAQPADTQHRFGHGKAEALAALFQVTLVTVSALAIGWRSIVRLIDGGQVHAAESGIYVSMIAIVATFALLAYQRKILRQTSSVAIGADHLHYQSDLLLNASVIIALLLDSVFHFGWADALFGVAIALWLLLGAYRGALESVDQLMDKEWPDEQRQELLSIAATHPKLKGIHDLRTRRSGNQDFVQFHMWVDPKMTVENAHHVMDEVEAILHQSFPDAEILIHPDPEGHIDNYILGQPDLTADLPEDASGHSTPA